MPRSKHASPFRIDWVLRGELALGPLPRTLGQWLLLKDEGVKAILTLCPADECTWPVGLEQHFACSRRVLPDHRSGRSPSCDELEEALEELARLRGEAGAVYVHCAAGMERSPLVCMAWLMRRRGLSRLQALDYLMQVHPGTSPLAGQLSLLAESSSAPARWPTRWGPC